jgi:hypothetical protein
MTILPFSGGRSFDLDGVACAEVVDQRGGNVEREVADPGRRNHATSSRSVQDSLVLPVARSGSHGDRVS